MADIDMTTRILKMYEALSRGKEIYKLPFCVEYGISGRTFDRDIEKIRLFLSEKYSGKEVEYNSDRGCYRIPGSSENGALSTMEIAIIVKILKGERALEKQEFEGVLRSLWSVAEAGQKRTAEELIQEEKAQYQEKEGQRAFLKLFSDLQKCIAERNIIRLKIKQSPDRRIRFFPVAVEYRFSEFYLLGYGAEDENRLSVFLLNEILSFQVSIQKYDRGVIERYSYQEGSDLLENMRRRKGEKTNETN